MARAQAPSSSTRIGVNNVGPTLIAHGTEEQRRRFLSKILSAETSGASSSASRRPARTRVARDAGPRDGAAID